MMELYLEKYMFNMYKLAVLAICGSLLLSAQSLADGCREAPKIVLQTALRCSDELGLTEDEKALIGGPVPDGGVLKEFSLCFYEGLGYYENGAFNMKNIKKFLLGANPNEEIVEPIYVKNLEHVEEAHAIEGHDSERTYSFYLHSYDPLMKELTKELWC